MSHGEMNNNACSWTFSYVCKYRLDTLEMSIEFIFNNTEIKLNFEGIHPRGLCTFFRITYILRFKASLPNKCKILPGSCYDYYISNMYMILFHFKFSTEITCSICMRTQRFQYIIVINIIFFLSL